MWPFDRQCWSPLSQQMLTQYKNHWQPLTRDRRMDIFHESIYSSRLDIVWMSAPVHGVMHRQAENEIAIHISKTVPHRQENTAGTYLSYSRVKLERMGAPSFASTWTVTSSTSRMTRNKRDRAKPVNDELDDNLFALALHNKEQWYRSTSLSLYYLWWLAHVVISVIQRQ